MQQLLNGGVERLLSLLYSVRSGLWLDRYAEEPRVRVMNSIANMFASPVVLQTCIRGVGNIQFCLKTWFKTCEHKSVGVRDFLVVFLFLTCACYTFQICLVLFRCGITATFGFRSGLESNLNKCL